MSAHDGEHRVCHRGVGGGAEVPDAPGEQNVGEAADDLQLVVDGRLVVVDFQRRQQ
jgi:hypothetical protein